MYRFFDKHGKKTLAVAAAFLMVAFLLPSTGLNCDSNFSQFGKIDGKAVDGLAMQSAHSRLQSLQRLIVIDPVTRQPMAAWDRIFSFRTDPVLGAILPPTFSRELYQRCRENEILWLLLVTEASDNFTIADEDEVNSFFSDNAQPQVLTQDFPTVVYQPLTNPPAIDDMKQSVRMALAVRDQFLRSLQSVKISTPMINDRLAERFQQAKARFAIFDASAYLKDLPAPTDEELKSHFDAYAAVVPQTFSDANPFGFGYRVPDRLRLQYIAVPEDQVMAAVLKSKDDFAWEEEARIYYNRNWEKFAEKPATTPATTQAATTQPTTTQAASTRPVKLPFDLVSAKVYDAIRQPLIEQRRRAVVNMVLELMNDDYIRLTQDLTATTQQVASTKVRGVEFSSHDYLLKVRDEVQKRHNVTVDVVNENVLVDSLAFRMNPGIGGALVEEVGPRDREQPAASYLFSQLRPLHPQAQTGQAELDLLEPTKPLWTPERTYIARVVEADPSHPAKALADVKDRVERDVRRKNAFAKAVEAAEAALAKGRQSGLSSLDQLVFTSDWFNGFDRRIPGVPIADNYASTLVRAMTEQLRGVSSKSQLPRHTVIKAQIADKVVAAELFDVETKISTNLDGFARARTRGELQMETIAYSGIVQNWFAPAAIMRRVNYVRPDGNAPEPDRPAPARPMIPG
jgi:hypothetical protein